jgi:hypothetical protein
VLWRVFVPESPSLIGGTVRWDGADAPGGPPKAEPGAESVGLGAAQRRHLIIWYYLGLFGSMSA